MNGESTSTDGRRRPWAWLVVAALILLCLPHQAYRAEQTISNYRLLDRSWQYSMPVLLGDGELAGRDFVYTYGPLYQVLHAPVLLVPGCELAHVARFHDLPEVVLSLLAVWIMLGWVGADGWWRLALFAAFALIVAAPEEFHGAHLKPVGGLFLLALAARGLERGARSAATLVAWAATPTLLTLYSFEFGLFALGVLLLLAVAVAAATWGIDEPEARRVRRDATWCAGAALVGSGTAAGLSTVLPAWRDYLAWEFKLAEAYAVAMAAPAGALALAMLAGSALAGLLVGGTMLGILRRQLRLARPLDGILVVLVMACASLAFVRYGLTRSGMSHVYRAVMPTVLLAVCFLPAWFGARRGVVALGAAAVVLFAVMPEFAAGWQQRWSAWGRAALGGTTLSVETDLARIAERIRDRPEQSVAVFPHGAALNLLSGKANACATLQFTEGALGPLEPVVIARLEATQDPLVAVLRRPPGVAPGSDVARNSAVVRHLLDRYELAAPPADEVLLLSRRDDTALAWVERPLLSSGQSLRFEPDGQNGIEFPLPADACRVSDFLALRVRVAPTSAALGKPGLLYAVLIGADGRRHVRPLTVAPDGQAQNVLLTALAADDAMFASAFQPGRWWRATERLAAVQIGWRPLDLLTRTPTEITCEAVAVLDRPGVETRESSVDKQRSAELRRWCFSRPDSRSAK